MAIATAVWFQNNLAISDAIVGKIVARDNKHFC